MAWDPRSVEPVNARKKLWSGDVMVMVETSVRSGFMEEPHPVGAENPIRPVQIASRYPWISPASPSVRRMQAGSGLVIGAVVSVASEGHRRSRDR
jgi:hypothetical protein